MTTATKPRATGKRTSAVDLEARLIAIYNRWHDGVTPIYSWRDHHPRKFEAMFLQHGQAHLQALEAVERGVTMWEEKRAERHAQQAEALAYLLRQRAGRYREAFTHVDAHRRQPRPRTVTMMDGAEARHLVELAGD